MHDLLSSRLEDLQREYHIGEQRLQALQAEAAQVRDTLLRIEGAMQVVRELLDQPSPIAPVSANHQPTERAPSGGNSQ